MKLGIVGTGAMGRTLRECAEKDEAFSEIAMIEPLDESSWPAYKTDLLIDFSHPKAILDIYEYCRKHGGNIPVVLATTATAPRRKKSSGCLQRYVRSTEKPIIHKALPQ